MADAACAEEEEALKRVLTRTTDLLATVRRIEAGEIDVDRGAILKSRDDVLHALRHLDCADTVICRSILSCRGCPQ
jgi:hypothetical protein